MFYNVFVPNRGANEEDFNKEGEQFKEPADRKAVCPRGQGACGAGACRKKPSTLGLTAFLF